MKKKKWDQRTRTQNTCKKNAELKKKTLQSANREQQSSNIYFPTISSSHHSVLIRVGLKNSLICLRSSSEELHHPAKARNPHSMMPLLPCSIMEIMCSSNWPNVSTLWGYTVDMKAGMNKNIKFIGKIYKNSIKRRLKQNSLVCMFFFTWPLSH